MSTFDELREACATWNERYRQYELESAQFAWNFAEGFRNYIGAPASYVDFDRTSKWYIELLKTSQNQDGVFSFDQPKFRTDAVGRDKDGYWITGLRVTIDQSENTYPKMYFVVLLRFAIREKTCEMKVGFESKSFTLDVAKSNEAVPAFDYMIGLIQSIFATPPWEVRQTFPIGFVPAANILSE